VYTESTTHPLPRAYTPPGPRLHATARRQAHHKVFATFSTCAFALQALSSLPTETTKHFVATAMSHQRLPVDRADLCTIGRIRELGMYEDGWDGGHAKAPNSATVRDAELFARLLFSVETSPPHVSLATDGEINFLWILPSIRLDLGFYGDGTYSYYGCTSTGEEFLADETSIHTRLPQRLLHLLVQR
jgi:hypothetical protein